MAGGRRAGSSTFAGKAMMKRCCSMFSDWRRPRIRCRAPVTTRGSPPTGGNKCYGYDYLYAGPLFTHQFSHIWIDFRGIQDAFMREKGIDYFENSRRATYVQHRYAVDNPRKFEGLWRVLLGNHGKRWSWTRNAQAAGHRTHLLRLPRARRSLWSGRRHGGALGHGRFLAIRPRDRPAGNGFLPESPK